MKIVFFSLLCLILIGMTSYSYAEIISFENFEKNKIKLPEVLLQMELRDSNGRLIAYIEAKQIIGIYPLGLDRFLDNQNQTHKEFFIKDDKKYEIQQWQQTSDRYAIKHAYSGTRLLDIYENTMLNVLMIRHDSFQTQPGDSLRIFWTVIRSASIDDNCPQGTKAEVRGAGIVCVSISDEKRACPAGAYPGLDNQGNFACRDKYTNKIIDPNTKEK